MKRTPFYLTLLAAAAFAFAGCGGDSDDGTAGGGGENGAGGGAAPTFSLAWSEYPSWSVFGVADELGLVEGDEGAMGEIEKKHNVDIVLREADYDTCLNMFSSEDVDAVCMTNMDALIVSPSRDGVAVLPTSTSNGADACVVTDKIETLEDLKGHEVYGLENSVSEYAFVRCIEEMGGKEEDFKFTNQDPAAAALAMQQDNESHQAIMVWNPFVMQTLKDRPDTKRLFDSTMIPGEIVDMVVVGKNVLDKEGAERFVKAVADAFYAVNRELEGDNADETLVALGKKFSNLGLEDMKQVVKETQFYKTPAEAKTLLESEEFKQTMQTVEEFCVSHDLVKDPSIGYGAEAAGEKLRFDASYLE